MREVIEGMAMRSIMLLMMLVLGGAEGRAAGIEGLSPARIVTLQEQHEIECVEDKEGEEPIMTIGYTSAQYRDNPLLRGGYSTATPTLQPAQFNPGSVISGLLLAIVLIFLAAALGILFLL